MFSSIEDILADVARGKPVIVVDDENRENEGDLVVAAQHATPQIINFMITQARGLVCVPLTKERIETLHLYPMHTRDDQDPFRTAWRISVDAATGVTTGISAYDRARTISVLIDPACAPNDLTRPGHLFPLQAQEGGVLVRAGHTEAAVDLARLSGCAPAGVICEIINEDGTMARIPDLLEFSTRHKLRMCTIASLIEYRRKKEKLIRKLEKVALPTEYGDFQLHLYESLTDGRHHAALVNGEISRRPVYVRVHSECLTGDVFFSRRCDCGLQLQTALEIIGKNGGVVLYMRQEGRGIGLEKKMKAYRLQEQGVDTVEANRILGFAPDLRDYGIGAQMLVDLGVKKIRLLTNNPKKIIGLEGYGLEIVERIGVKMKQSKNNRRYLETKKTKMDHML
ncbi:MAG: bifunctional 3,4-dihydroxy-2-butanone-4-phosphate synthase/GTP cyclohydrolase II [Candidatus Omnitrophica bacterium]|nr:bifunctional 3,4-dihydroxy-2-butanone-4-phosphate synthase/GTP cyclohydrolase II [Candidatus Omnitrophota bacterium]